MSEIWIELAFSVKESEMRKLLESIKLIASMPIPFTGNLPEDDYSF
jgi:hypothetical protein